MYFCNELKLKIMKTEKRDLNTFVILAANRMQGLRMRFDNGLLSADQYLRYSFLIRMAISNRIDMEVSNDK